MIELCPIARSSKLCFRRLLQGTGRAEAGPSTEFPSYRAPLRCMSLAGAGQAMAALTLAVAGSGAIESESGPQGALRFSLINS